MSALLGGLRSAVLCAIGLGLAGAVGVWLKQPWVFPSLGPTLMVVAETPDEPASRAQNVLVGHVIGILCGLAGLQLTGLRHHSSAIDEGLTSRRVMCACLALAATALLLQVVGLPHPPAGATTLIVALGILRTDGQLRTMLLAVVLVSLLAGVAQIGSHVAQRQASR